MSIVERESDAPGGQQKGTFQDELFRVARTRQAVKETLHRIVLEQFLKKSLLSTGLVHQAVAYRCAKFAFGQSTASTYGRITRSTRQMRAYSTSLFTASFPTRSR